MTAIAHLSNDWRSGGVWSYTEDGQKHVFERLPSEECRDNWVERKSDGQHNPYEYVVYASTSLSTGWKYGKQVDESGSKQYPSGVDAPHATEFDVMYEDSEGAWKQRHFEWVPRPNATMLTVHAVKDGQELWSEDIKLENIMFDEEHPERRLSYNYAWLFAKDQQVNLKASAQNDVKFDRWEDDSTIAERMITMDQAHDLSAFFSDRR